MVRNRRKRKKRRGGGGRIRKKKPTCGRYIKQTTKATAISTTTVPHKLISNDVKGVGHTLNNVMTRTYVRNPQCSCCGHRAHKYMMYPKRPSAQ